MPKARAKSVFYLEPTRESLVTLIHRLNAENVFVHGQNRESAKSTEIDVRQTRYEFHRLLHKWLASKRNTNKMFESDHGLRSAARQLEAEIVPNGTDAKLHLTFRSGVNEAASKSRQAAIAYFFWVILNPFSYLIQGPCRQCGKCFVKRGLKQKVYCSRSCASRCTSGLANKKRRDSEERDRLDRAREAILRWAASKRRTDWKDATSRETGISKSFLTRRVKAGLLIVPD